MEEITRLIDNQVVFILSRFGRLNRLLQYKTTKTIAKLFYRLASGISKTVAIRDRKNGPDTEEINAVMPHQLVALSGKEFSSQVMKFKDLLENSIGSTDIHEIEAERNALVNAFHGDGKVENEITNLNELKSDFRDGWDGFRDAFPRLYRFCSGLATLFPGTASVESDFSILRWEKNAYRSSLSDLCLEGILHAKQLKKLRLVK